jgi:hypothetical protein
VTYFILGCAASFYAFTVRRERKVKEIIVYVSQEAFSIDYRKRKKNGDNKKNF